MRTKGRRCGDGSEHLWPSLTYTDREPVSATISYLAPTLKTNRKAFFQPIILVLPKNFLERHMTVFACFACAFAERHMYWCCRAEIYKADLNGDNIVQLYVTTESLTSITDLELDNSGERGFIVHLITIFVLALEVSLGLLSRCLNMD